LVYFHRNHQYSVTAITTSTGAIAERYAYSAYGQPTILDASASVLSSSAINNRYTYTGREWDATLGLHHFRARWMSPCAGRFLGRDPIGYEGSPFGLTEFLSSGPLISIDPEGERTGITPGTRVPNRPIRPNYPTPGSPGNPRLPRLPWQPIPKGEIPIEGSNPWHPQPLPLPPGYPKPGVAPGPGDPNYPKYVKRCWYEWKNDCFLNNPGIPSCATLPSPTLDDFIEQNKHGGIWPSENRYEFVNCREISSFNQPSSLPTPNPWNTNPWPASPCGSTPGKTYHCQVMVFSPSGRIWLSRRDAVSYFTCKCCDPNNPYQQPADIIMRPHFPGGNRPPNHNIDP